MGEPGPWSRFRFVQSVIRKFWYSTDVYLQFDFNFCLRLAIINIASVKLGVQKGRETKNRESESLCLQQVRYLQIVCVGTSTIVLIQDSLFILPFTDLVQWDVFLIFTPSPNC